MSFSSACLYRKGTGHSSLHMNAAHNVVSINSERMCVYKAVVQWE